MKMLVVLSVLMAVNMAATSTAGASHGEKVRKAHHESAWISRWTDTDESIYPAINKAAWIFKVDSGLLRTIVGREGGNINPRTLKSSLCNATQPGWNLNGSYAFGPFQFMLEAKPACHWNSRFQHGGWGTFGTYVFSAFSNAKRLGHPIPYRFKIPSSNVGQAITAAYMIANPILTGGLHHWCASMC